MESSFKFKKPSSSIIITVLLSLFLLLLLLSSLFLSATTSSRRRHYPSRRSPPPQHSVIKNTCTKTLYPSLCLHTLSSIPVNKFYPNHHAQLRHFLEFAIQKTIKRVTKTRMKLAHQFANSQPLNSEQGSNWVDNCVELLDQTLYELEESMAELYDPYDHEDQQQQKFQLPYASIKNLLSAAMTNENTCIEGFSELKMEAAHLRRYVRRSLTPIMRMISNCLAMIKSMEANSSSSSRDDFSLKESHLLMKDLFSDDAPTWMTTGDRRLMEREAKKPPESKVVVVAADGSGDFRNISAAVRMAPDESRDRHVIQIKAGVYNENVVIPRQKTNIMLVGEGMNSTVITASKNYVDGYATFTSATLTVIGNKFMARDLTVINASGPEKHQAVAVRVTSNAAFFHCQFISHQDTLYAHSLSQLYRECAIQGTIDFIFGNAAAIFERCLILIRKPIPGQKNVITAQGRLDPNQNTGISINECTIMASPDFEAAERAKFSTYLGRPWRNYSRTVVMRSYLGELIDGEGWCRWDEYSDTDTVEYIEYMNYGPGSDTRKRVRWGGYHNNSSREVDKFTVHAFLHGADEWIKSAPFPLCTAIATSHDCQPTKYPVKHSHH